MRIVRKTTALGTAALGIAAGLVFTSSVFASSAVAHVIHVAQEPAKVLETGGVPYVAGKKWALCVGAGTYRHLSPLAYAASDARAIGETLTKEYGFSPSTVRVLSDGVGGGEAPTSANILAALDAQLADRRLDRGDLFVFFFSGHGIGTPKGDYLVPTDVSAAEVETKGVPMREIVDRFARAGLKNALILVDACRAGEANPFGADLIKLGRKTNLALMLGCSPGEKSYEFESLKHGAFTHFLLRRLADPAMADPKTGAIFASAIGERVAREVKEYTEAEYGEEAQKPSIWTEKTQDVLLGARVGSVAGGEAMAAALGAFKTDRLDKGQYARYMSTLGEIALGRGDAAFAIDALKIVDGLGEAGDADLYRLASALRRAGRYAEGAVVAARLAGSEHDTDWRGLGVLLSDIEDVPIARRREAIWRFYRPSEFGPFAVELVDEFLRTKLDADRKESLAAIVRMTPDFPPDSRAGLFLAARGAALRRETDAALALAKRGAAAPGDMPTQDGFRRIRYEALDDARRDIEVDSIIAEGTADAEARFPWATEAMKRAVARRDPNALALIRRAGAQAQGPDAFIKILSAAGDEAPALLPEAQALRTRFPYSWEAHVAVWLCERSRDFGLELDFDAETLKYAPNPLELQRYAFRKLDFLVSRSLAKGRINGYKAAGVRGVMVDRLLEQYAEIKKDPRALASLVWLLCQTPDTVHTVIVLGDNEATIRGAVPARDELLTAGLYAALNVGDLQTADEHYALLIKEDRVSPLATLRWALGHALAGKDAEAITILGTLPEQTGDVPQGYIRGVRAIALAHLGKKAEAQSEIDGIVGVDAVSELISGLAAAEIGDRKEISTVLAGAVVSPPGMWIDLYASCLKAMSDAFDSAPGPRTRQAELIASFAADYPGNRLFKSIHFGGGKAVGDYEGAWTLKGTFRGGRASVDAGIVLLVNKAGVVTGVMQMGDTEFTFTGDVDAFGNLMMDTYFEGKQTLIVAGKLAPVAVYNAHPDLKKAGIMLKMFGRLDAVVSFRSESVIAATPKGYVVPTWLKPPKGTGNSVKGPGAKKSSVKKAPVKKGGKSGGGG